MRPAKVTFLRSHVLGRSSWWRHAFLRPRWRSHALAGASAGRRWVDLNYRSKSTVSFIKVTVGDHSRHFPSRVGKTFLGWHRWRVDQLLSQFLLSPCTKHDRENLCERTKEQADVTNRTWRRFLPFSLVSSGWASWKNQRKHVTWLDPTKTPISDPGPTKTCRVVRPNEIEEAIS